MYELNVKYSAKDILDKDFKYDTKGYRPQEVDQFLDDIITDYESFHSHISRLNKINHDLQEENNSLKQEIRKLKMDFESAMEEGNTGKFTTNNVDLLKRISNLEKIVYGKDE